MSTRVLLAGFDRTAALIYAQYYLPLAAELEISFDLWAPPAPAPPQASGEEVGDRAADFNQGVLHGRLDTADRPDLSGVAAVIATSAGEQLVTLFEAASQAGVPVLVHNPWHEDVDRLAQLRERFSAVPFLPGPPLQGAASLATVEQAVNSGEIGLLRALHIDVVAAGPRRPHSDLLSAGARHLLMARRLLSDDSFVLRATHIQQGDSAAWSVLGKSARALVLAAHIGHVPAEHSELLISQVRVIGAHGTLMANLLCPRLTVHRPERRHTVNYGPAETLDAVNNLLARRLGDPADVWRDTVDVAVTLQGCRASAADGRVEHLTWGTPRPPSSLSFI